MSLNLGEIASGLRVLNRLHYAVPVTITAPHMGEEDKDEERKGSRMVDFAPADYTDGRQPLEWETKYPLAARKKIRVEGLYLGGIFLTYSIAVFVFLYDGDSILSSKPDPQKLLSHLYGWSGGTIGGTLFSIKWLYHSVAKRLWHEDRRLWRLFTPHISGAVAFFTILLIGSGILQIFNPELVKNSTGVLGFAFVVGYFSDKALAKLAETADTLFGVTEKELGRSKS